MSVKENHDRKIFFLLLKAYSLRPKMFSTDCKFEKVFVTEVKQRLNFVFRDLLFLSAVYFILFFLTKKFS